MREVKILRKSHLQSALRIVAKAYPMMDLSSDKKIEEFETKILEDFGTSNRTWYGLFDNGVLLGCMVLFHFHVNFFGKEIPAMGIGAVAVNFLHKKQKVCKEMIQWYLNHSKLQKYPLAMLYAFRPDFYKNMGFGFGTICYNYVITPRSISPSPNSLPMEYLSVDDTDEVADFYHRLYLKGHGMVARTGLKIMTMLKTPGVIFVGYREQGLITALLSFRLTSNESTNNQTDMDLGLLYTSPQGLQAALNFLNSQADQVRQIFISTHEQDLFYKFMDIRHIDQKILRAPAFHHTSDMGMGVMYRSLNPIELLKKRPSDLNNLKIRFQILDNFLEHSHSDFVMVWKDGIASLSRSKTSDLTIKIDVSDFSSWILNAIELSTLYKLGLVDISDSSYLSLLDRAFYYHDKPVCLERF